MKKDSRGQRAVQRTSIVQWSSLSSSPRAQDRSECVMISKKKKTMRKNVFLRTKSAKKIYIKSVENAWVYLCEEG